MTPTQKKLESVIGWILFAAYVSYLAYDLGELFNELY
jgi:hypothetical protein